MYSRHVPSNHPRLRPDVPATLKFGVVEKLDPDVGGARSSHLWATHVSSDIDDGEYDSASRSQPTWARTRVPNWDKEAAVWRNDEGDVPRRERSMRSKRLPDDLCNIGRISWRGRRASSSQIP